MTIPAGEFSRWLNRLESAMNGQGDSDVPCGECTACCTSSQFVYIGPEEKQTIAHIPRKLLFPAPGRDGYILGYNERGHCPMFMNTKCSIYAHRPRTCRTYDCRVFSATGISPDKNQPGITSRANEWKFSSPSPRDQLDQDAVRAAGKSLLDHPELLPGGMPPTQLAALAVRLHSLFLTADPPGICQPLADVLKREIARILGSESTPANSA
jgi:Fe-S-cluster containining protein